MGRAPCCDKIGLKKGPWTADEDHKLTSYIQENGHGSWRALPKKAGLLRCGKSCRLRWTNYLRPDIKRGEFSSSEEQSIIQLHALLGNRWSAIATHLPKRTDNEIKNYWNTHLKKRLIKMGIDPVTHKPSAATHESAASQNSASAKATPAAAASAASNGGGSHVAQWESVRLEAEARLAKEAEMRSKGLWPTSASSSAAAAAAAAFASSSAGASSSSDSIDALQNPDKALQGFLYNIWSDPSWRLILNSASGSYYHSIMSGGSDVGQESSSCCSHDSPTSTLTTIDQATASKELSSAEASGLKAINKKKLSWTDSLLQSGGGGSGSGGGGARSGGGEAEEAKAKGMEEDEGSSYDLEDILENLRDAGEAGANGEWNTNGEWRMRRMDDRDEEEEECEITYSDLLNEEEYDWMLKEVVDSDPIMDHVTSFM